MAEDRGALLKRELLEEPGYAPFTRMQLELLEEMCRIANRLDQLDAILRGAVADWVRAEKTADGYTLVVDSVLSEARQHAMALKTLETALRRPALKPGEMTAPAPATAPAGKDGALDVLSRRRADRRAASAGM